MASFSNVYEDRKRAESYATLEFPGTYYLAYRDLPELIAKHVVGGQALDFGCGAGRSTRFLKNLGFNAVGIDISESMIHLAREIDPDGRYELIEDGDFSALGPKSFDLIFSAFAFDNIPGVDRRAMLLRGLSDLLNENGRIILLCSTPEIYVHEWASFTTKDFPDNCKARSGEHVQIVMTDVEDQRPVVDSIWFPEDYLQLFLNAGLQLIEQHKPLGEEDEPYDWISETTVAPWVIYVLTKLS